MMTIVNRIIILFLLNSRLLCFVKWMVVCFWCGQIARETVKMHPSNNREIIKKYDHDASNGRSLQNKILHSPESSGFSSATERSMYHILVVSYFSNSIFCPFFFLTSSSMLCSPFEIPKSKFLAKRPS